MLIRVPRLSCFLLLVSSNPHRGLSPFQFCRVPYFHHPSWQVCHTCSRPRLFRAFHPSSTRAPIPKVLSVWANLLEVLLIACSLQQHLNLAASDISVLRSCLLLPRSTILIAISRRTGFGTVRLILGGFTFTSRARGSMARLSMPPGRHPAGHVLSCQAQSVLSSPSTCYRRSGARYRHRVCLYRPLLRPCGFDSYARAYAAYYRRKRRLSVYQRVSPSAPAVGERLCWLLCH